MSKNSKSHTISPALAELTKCLAKPLSPEAEKLAEAALNDVKKASARRLKHKLPENSEPSIVFEIRSGATTQW